MTYLKQKTILLVGADDMVAQALADSFRRRGDSVHRFEDPFLIPSPGSRVADGKKEQWATDELDQLVQEIGTIDLLVTCLSLNAQHGSRSQPNFAAVYASAIKQLSRAMSAVLPGMIILQRGKIVTLVTAHRQTVGKPAYHAAITAAASVTDRIAGAIERDNIQAHIMFHRGRLSGDSIKALAQKVVGLAIYTSPPSSCMRLVGECLRTVSDTTVAANLIRLN
ncbi:SDR family NAD(P)-dependent oxidoreductase [Phyllobacterium sp. LjRoot231]|uniref:SDR family NAD(P)-dependent oxidoreductase n=1 Tax=Phyllobacterium sp. LjRoot231 TaxID=3342289 RepID=UPI003ECF8A3E